MLHNHTYIHTHTLYTFLYYYNLFMKYGSLERKNKLKINIKRINFFNLYHERDGGKKIRKFIFFKI